MELVRLAFQLVPVFEKSQHSGKSVSFRYVLDAELYDANVSLSPRDSQLLASASHCQIPSSLYMRWLRREWTATYALGTITNIRRMLGIL